MAQFHLSGNLTRMERPKTRTGRTEVTVRRLRTALTVALALIALPALSAGCGDPDAANSAESPTTTVQPTSSPEGDPTKDQTTPSKDFCLRSKALLKRLAPSEHLDPTLSGPQDASLRALQEVLFKGLTPAIKIQDGVTCQSTPDGQFEHAVVGASIKVTTLNRAVSAEELQQLPESGFAQMQATEGLGDWASTRP